MSRPKKQPEKTSQELSAQPEKPQAIGPLPVEEASRNPVPADVVALLAAQVSSTFTGPLPPPAILAEYNQIIPGAAERILKMAEEQSAHRRGLEAKVIGSDVFRANTGMWIGAAVSLLSIVVGGLLVYSGHDVAGTTIATGVVVSLVGVFVYGAHDRRKERDSKAGAPSTPKPSTKNQSSKS